jgi:hypothetical protein
MRVASRRLSDRWLWRTWLEAAAAVALTLLLLLWWWRGPRQCVRRWPGCDLHARSRCFSPPGHSARALQALRRLQLRGLHLQTCVRQVVDLFRASLSFSEGLEQQASHSIGAVRIAHTDTWQEPRDVQVCCERFSRICRCVAALGAWKTVSRDASVSCNMIMIAYTPTRPADLRGYHVVA